MSTKKTTSRVPHQLQKLLSQLQQRFAPLALREKAIITAVLFAAVFMLVQLLALDPLLKQRTSLQQQQEQLTQDLNQQQVERDTLTLAINAGPKRQKQQQLETLKQELVTLDEQIARTTSTMIPARKMTDVLREVMRLRENLKLVQLENLAPLPLLEDSKSVDNTGNNANAGANINATADTSASSAHASVASEVGLYRHGVRLVFEGDYMTTMAFLESLEQKSWRFFWQSLQYDVEQYPKARVTLTLYTLSPERAWLGV